MKQQEFYALSWCLSGGKSNDLTEKSIGGRKSVHLSRPDLWGPACVRDEDQDDYRCLYVMNYDLRRTACDVRVWLKRNDGKALSIGLGLSPVGGLERKLKHDKRTPTRVEFVAPRFYTRGLVIGTLIPGQHKAIWLRRTTFASDDPALDVSATVSVKGWSWA